MKPVISLSTSYLQRSFGNDGYAMLQEAAALGYEYVEISHSTPIAAVEGIEKALAEGVVKVSSTHNFCPLPPFCTRASPDLYSPSTSAKKESSQWLRHTKNSLAFGAKIGAKALVCHTGNLPYFFRRPDSGLLKFLAKKNYDGILQDEKYLKALAKFSAKAEKISVKAYAYMLENFNLLADTAKEGGIMLCIENRERPMSLPLEKNFAHLMELFAEIPQVKAWHDVGHSMIKQLTGFCRQSEFAETLLPYQAGWHLHDCTSEGKDHVAIGDGCIDFKALAKFFDPAKHIFTLELNSAVERQAARDSLKRVEDMMP